MNIEVLKPPGGGAEQSGAGDLGWSAATRAIESPQEGASRIWR
jgi:hypothetical protein